MEHLFFPGRTDAMHVDGAFLDNAKTFAAICFAKKVFPFIEVL